VIKFIKRMWYMKVYIIKNGIISGKLGLSAYP